MPHLNTKCSRWLFGHSFSLSFEWSSHQVGEWRNVEQPRKRERENVAKQPRTYSSTKSDVWEELLLSSRVDSVGVDHSEEEDVGDDDDDRVGLVGGDSMVSALDSFS